MSTARLDNRGAEDLVIIGGGVMGLFTAYHASAQHPRVVVLERGRVGDPMTASFGRTRSYRSDYLDATYARFAREAYRLWGEFESETGADVLVRCGCLNVAKRSVTPELGSTYAELAFRVQQELGIPSQAWSRAELRARLPDLEADVGYLDADGGVVDLPAVTRALTGTLAARGVRVLEGTGVRSVRHDADGFAHVVTDRGDFVTRALVVTAGHGTNEVLARIEGAALEVPITKDRPIEARYYTPPAGARERFTAERMPVIAYLDAGIYLHPIVDGLAERVKIGYYHPPDLPRGVTSIGSVAAFVEQCLPGLRGAESEPVADTDGCDYDLVGDDEFVLGAVPGFAGAYVGVGWRGTGYKFAPWVGRVLAQLALQRGTVYDIGRFTPARFTKGQTDAISSHAHAASR